MDKGYFIGPLRVQYTAIKETIPHSAYPPEA